MANSSRERVGPMCLCHLNLQPDLLLGEQKLRKRHSIGSGESCSPSPFFFLSEVHHQFTTDRAAQGVSVFWYYSRLAEDKIAKRQKEEEED